MRRVALVVVLLLGRCVPAARAQELPEDPPGLEEEPDVGEAPGDQGVEVEPAESEDAAPGDGDLPAGASVGARPVPEEPEEPRPTDVAPSPDPGIPAAPAAPLGGDA